MKKKMEFIIVVFLAIFLCSACDGDVTRAIRHDGFNVGNDFVCDAFFSDDKDVTEYEKIKYLTGSNIITEKGRIYEVSMGQQYANESNCKVADTKIEVVAIFDNKVVKASDGKLYYLIADNQSEPYTEVTDNDSSYLLYDLLLKPEGTIKVMTVNSNDGVYYVLKNDGNVYNYTVTKTDRYTPPTISSTALMYNKSDYGSDIVDFNYAGNSGATFVRTDKKAYKMSATNSKECSKYVDVECDYKLEEFSSFSEYRDYIVAYNGSTVITNYGRTFNVLN